MRVFEDAAEAGAALPGAWLAIGNFDGLHAGHRSILRRLRDRARAAGAPATVMTFRPHPAALLSPRGAPACLACPAQQRELLEASGLDGLLVQRFDRDFSAVSAEAFREEWLVKRLAVRGVLVGSSFRFGQGRAGDVASLRAQAAGRYEVEAAEPVMVDGEVASSTRARRLIAEGDVAAAWRLLERPHAVEGVVVQGDRRGRALGFPTANVDSGAQALPRAGVYATALRVGERRLAAVTNVGTRPTFQGTRVVAETHALEDPGDLYGLTVRVAYLARLRDERRFESAEALVAEVRADIAAARSIHAAHPPDSLAGPAF